MTEAEDAQLAAEIAAVVREFGETNAMVADKHFEFGTMLSTRTGEEKRAIWQFESCLSIQRANFGDMTLSVAVTLQKLGNLHATMGNFKKALSAYYASLERYAHLFGKDTQQIADLLRDVAAVYEALKRDDAHETLLTKASQLEEALGSGAEKTQYFIDVYADLADVVAASGHYAESDGLYRTCIQLAAHHQTGREAARYNFKYAKQLETRFEQDMCEQYYHAAAELSIEYPELCLMTAECKYFLGHAAKDQHRLSDATKYLEEALELWQKHLGQKNALVGKCYLKIAQVFRQLEEFEKAIYYHEKSIAVLHESSRSPTNPEDLDKIPGLKEASSIDFLVHAKGELGITLQRHSQDEARRGNSLVTDAVSHLVDKQYSSEHPLVSTLLKAKSDWRVGASGAFESDVSIDLTASVSPRPIFSAGGLRASMSDLSRPPTATLSTGSSTPMSVMVDGGADNEFAESQFKEVYGSTGGSLGATGETKTVPEMIDSLLLQAGDMLMEGRYVPTNHTLLNCYNTAKIGLHLTDPISGTRLTENVSLLNNIGLAAAESSRRVGQFEFAKTVFFEVMAARGIDIESPSKAALNLQRSPYNDDKIGDIEVLLGYISLLLDQENLLAIDDALDVMADTLKKLSNGGSVDLFMVNKNVSMKSEAGHGPSAKALSRAGMVYARVLQAAATYHLRCGRLVTSCEFLAQGSEICDGADDATNQMLSLLRIVGNEGDSLYRPQRRVFLGEYSTIECSFYLTKAQVHVVLKDFQEAMECSRKFQNILHSLGISTSHPIVAAFELLASDLSLCDGNLEDARGHNKKAFSIYSLVYLEDHPVLADALFKSAEISRLEGKEHKASSTYGTALEMTTRLRGHGTISEALIQASQAINILTNTAPSPADFSEALSLLKSARNKLAARLPYETHYLILTVDMQVLDALRMQLCGVFPLNLNDHAGYLMNAKELEAAYGRILKIAREFFETDYRSIPPSLYAGILTGQAHLLRYTGQFNEAEGLYNTATELMKEVYGSDEFSPVSSSMLNFAQVWRDRGKMFPNLASIVSSDVEVKTRTYGRQHPTLADSLEVLGRILADYGHFSPDHYTRAQQVLVQAAVIRSHVFGVGSLPVASSEDALGVLCTRRNKHDDAVAYLNRALSVRVQNLGPGHRLVGETHANLALAFWNIGDLKLCKEHAQEYYDTTNGVLSGSHPMVLIASAFYAKVRLTEVKTRVVKVSPEEKEDIEKTYKNSREILMYGCGFERHAWWVMFLCGIKVASPSLAWHELSPPELDNPSTQFKCGSSSATSIAGRLVRADTETNLLQERHEQLVVERDELLRKFKHYESTMKIGDIMQLAAENKELGEKISALNEKLSEAGGLMVQKDVAELDLLSIYKIHRSEEELHKSELKRLRGAVSLEEKKSSLIRLPDAELPGRVDQASIYGMIEEKKHLKDLLVAVDEKADGLLRTRKAVTDEIDILDEGIRKETDFLSSADNERNELLIQIGAGNVTTLKLSTQLGKSKQGVGPNGAVDEAIDICRSAFEEIVTELNRATEKDASVELAERDIIRLKRDIESHKYDLETGIKDMNKRQIAKTKSDLHNAEAALLKREENIVKWKDERIILSSHVVLLKCKLRDAQQLLFILKGVGVGKYEAQYEYASSLWDQLYELSKTRDGIQAIIDKFEDIETDKSLNQLGAELEVSVRKVDQILGELRTIELQVPARREDEDESVVFEEELSVGGSVGGAGETDAIFLQNAKDEVERKEHTVSTLWADVLGSLHEQEELKKKVSEVQSQIGTNEIAMRNLRQSVKSGGKANSGKAPVITRQYSSSSANPRSMKEVNLILSEAEGRQAHLKEKTIALNKQLVAICERENLGTLVQTMSPAVVADSYAKDLAVKIKQLEEEHAIIASEIEQTKTDIGLTSKDLHVLEVEISRVEGASKSSNFQSRDPEVTRLVSMLKAKEMTSIDEVEAEQQAFINVGIIRERVDQVRNDLALARQQNITTPTNASLENRNRLTGLQTDKKVLSDSLTTAIADRDQKKRIYLTARSDSEAVDGDVKIVEASNKRAASPLLKERGESAKAVLEKMKSFTDENVSKMQVELDIAEQNVYSLRSQLDDVDSSIEIIENELAAQQETSTKSPSEIELERKVKLLERQYAEASAEHEAAQSSLVALKASVQKSDEDKHIIRDKIKDMIAKEKEELLGAGDKLPKLVQDRSELSDKMTALTTSLSNSQEKEKSIAKELSGSNQKYAEVTTALSEAEKTKQLTASTEMDLKLLRGRSTKMEQELSTKLVDETPEETMQKTQLRIDELTQEEQKYLQSLESVERKIDTDQAALTRAVEASRVAKSALEKAEQKFDDSNVKERDSIVAVGLLEGQLRLLEENIAEEAENLQKLRIQKRQMTDQLMKVDIEVVAINAEKQRLLSKNDPITPGEVEACNSRKERISKELEILREWVHKDEQRRMLEFHPDVKKKLESDLREAKDLTVLGLLSMADASKRYDKKLQDAAGEIKTRDDKLDAADETNRTLQNTIQAQKTENNTLVSKIEELNNMLKSANDTISKRNKAIVEKDEKIAQLNVNLKELPMWEGKLAGAQQKITEQSEYIEELTQKMHLKEDQLEKVKTDALEKNVEYRKAESTINDLTKAKLSLESDLIRKRQECERAVDRADKMQTETEAMQAKVLCHEVTLNKNEKERSRLSGELSRAEDTISTLKRTLGPLEIKDQHQRDEIEQLKHHILRLEDEIKTIMGMRKSLDPWGFGKEAEAGFSRFATIKNIIEPVPQSANAWDKDHELRDSNNAQKRAFEDPLQPDAKAFDQLNQGAAPVKIFGGVRSLHVKDDRRPSPDHPCTFCGHYPDGRGGGGSSHRTAKELFLNDHLRQTEPKKVVPSAPALEGTSPRAQSEHSGPSTPKEGFGQQNSRSEKPLGLFPAVDGAVKPLSAGRDASKQKRIKKKFPDKFSKSTPSALHAAFGSEPFGDMMGAEANSPNQGLEQQGSHVSPRGRNLPMKESSVSSVSTSRTTKL